MRDGKRMKIKRRSIWRRSEGTEQGVRVKNWENRVSGFDEGEGRNKALCRPTLTCARGSGQVCV